MKKILIVTNHSYMLWRFRKELIQKLLEEHQVVISTPFVGHEKDFENMGCEMIETQLERRGINPFTDLKLYKTYQKILQTQRPDMVITYSIKPNVYAGFACRMRKIPYCVNVQGLGTAFQKKGLAQIVTLMYKTALKRAKVVFFENEVNAKIFRDKKITPAVQQKVLNGAGINLEEYSCEPYPENDKIHFLYLGRIMKEKGIDELFHAMKELHQEYGEKAVLDLVGFFEDEYKEQVERLAADGIAVFHGFQKDPKPYYRAADCVVLPSYHEGMSNVLLEAAAMGRPVITSDIPGCRESVLNDKSGYLCEVKNAQELTAQMKRFCELTKEERAQMGRVGRKFMEEKFDKKKVVAETVSVILKHMGE
ncbi:MAG: glycosyltransferase family 4 protein [Lachnospiraceae bacterium]